MNNHDSFAEDAILYALGSLEGEGRQRFEAHLESCAECRRELQAIQEEFGLLALSTTGPKPPQRSRERFLTALEKEPRTRARQEAPVGKGWIWIPWFATLAFALLSALLYFANLRLRSDIAAVRSSATTQETELQHTREMLDMFKAPNVVRVTLMPGKDKPKPQGKTLYSPERGRLIFMASNLPPAPSNKMYELWLVPMQGAPIPAGMFQTDESGNAMIMQSTLPVGTKAKAFAVTVEQAEGSTTPTMPMVLSGTP